LGARRVRSLLLLVPRFRQQPRQRQCVGSIGNARGPDLPIQHPSHYQTGRAAWKLRLRGISRRPLSSSVGIKEQTAARESVSAPSTLSKHNTNKEEAMLLRRRSGVLALLLAVAAGVAVLVVEAFAPSSFQRACLALACCVVRQRVGDDRPVLGQTNDPKY